MADRYEQPPAANSESPEQVEVTISVTARLSVYEVADLYERIGEVAEFYCGDTFTMRQVGPPENGREVQS